MSRSRLRFKILGACALAFSLMAVWAGVAQAEETGGSWTYINKSGELKTFEGVLLEPEIGGKIDVTVVLHSEALEGTKVLYECKALGATAGSRLKANGVMLGKVSFSECVAFLNGVVSLPCKPKNGTVTTNLVKAQMLLHKGSRILIAEGETEAGALANLATIETEGACALGVKIPVGGKFAYSLSGPSEHVIEHLVTEFPALTAMWILSNTAEHKATLLGSGWAFLEGAHEGLKWAGLWN